MRVVGKQMQPHMVLLAQMDSLKPVPESGSLKVGWYVSTQGLARSSTHPFCSTHAHISRCGWPQCLQQRTASGSGLLFNWKGEACAFDPPTDPGMLAHRSRIQPGL